MPVMGEDSKWADLIAQGRGFRALGQHALEGVEGQGEDEIVKC